MSLLSTALIVFWMVAGTYAWFKYITTYKKLERATNSDSLWWAHGNGYATALIDEGYSKGEAVGRAKRHIQEARRGGGA